jgi:NAD(P)-dependent dehydrogenase (short-subunit alcohol dehydrogenase family)
MGAAAHRVERRVVTMASSTSREGRLAGKVALITGGASGIGLAAARLFAAEGARVAVADRDAEAAARVANELTAAGYAATGLGVDVTDEASVAYGAAETSSRLGRIDVLFANAGVGTQGGILSTTIDEWDRVLGINLTGVWLSMRAVVPQMIDSGGGSIVVVSSLAATRATGATAYAAAKGGVLSMSRQAAAELAPHGIRVNAILPGPVRTPLYEAQLRRRTTGDLESAHDAYAARVPLGRIGEAEDIAHYALFLASDESSWITGGEHVADGGISSSLAPVTIPKWSK